MDVGSSEMYMLKEIPFSFLFFSFFFPLNWQCPHLTIYIRKKKKKKESRKTGLTVIVNYYFIFWTFSYAE